MIPDSLKRVLRQQAEPRGDVTTVWRDGTIIRETARGKVQELPAIAPLPDTDDDPFPP